MEGFGRLKIKGTQDFRITRENSAKKISLDQEGFITQILEEFGMDQSSPIRTPMNITAIIQDDIFFKWRIFLC